MKSALEKILSYKVKDGRVTSQSDKEQWTCLQKIIAINKLIVDYHNAFVELKESYQDLLDRYNEINAEWDVLKTDMEAIATEWTQFKPLVQQIINLWENTITPTFEEWTTLMNNWGNTMDGYSDTMADYEQQMMNIQQEFNEIETAWGNITLAVRGQYEEETISLSATTINKLYLISEYNDFIVVPASGSVTALIRFGSTAVSASESTALAEYKGWRVKYAGNISDNSQAYEYYTPSKTGIYWTDPTETTIGFILSSMNAGQVTIYKRHVPYFSADESAEVQEALTKADEALTKATNAQISATSAMQAAQQALVNAGNADTKAQNADTKAQNADTKAQNALTKCGQLESGKMSNSMVECITTDMSTLAETRSYALKTTDPNMFVYIEGIPNTNSGYLCCSIPLSSIPKTTGTGTSGGRRYQLTDEANYFSFTLAFNDISATLYITFSTRAQAAAKITRVALYG